MFKYKEKCIGKMLSKVIDFEKSNNEQPISIMLRNFF
jgi:hypothetical protein